jgi:hypothetical protein
MSWIVENWTIILSVLTTGTAWIVSPRVKLRALRTQSEAEEVEQVIQLNQLIRAELDRMNKIIDGHTEEIGQLRLSLFDEQVMNRSLREQLGRAELDRDNLQQRLDQCKNSPACGTN